MPSGRTRNTSALFADRRPLSFDRRSTTAVGWLRKRWKDDRDKNPGPRPRQLRVYDQEARIVQVDIDLPDGEPKVRTDESDRHHHDKPVGARRRNPDPPDPEVDGPEDPEPQ